MTSCGLDSREGSTEFLLLKILKDHYRSHKHPGVWAASCGTRQKQAGFFMEQQAEGFNVESVSTEDAQKE